MNLSGGGFNDENKTFNEKSSFRRDILQTDSRTQLNETDLMSRTLTRTNRSKSKPSLKSPLRSTFSYFNTSQNGSRKNMFEPNSMTLRKTPKTSQINFFTDKPMEKANRKHEYYQIK